MHKLIALAILVLAATGVDGARAASCPSELISLASPVGGSSNPTAKLAAFATRNEVIMCDGRGNVSAHIYDVSVSLTKDGNFFINYDFYNGSATRGGLQKFTMIAADNTNTDLFQLYSEQTPRELCTRDGVRTHVVESGKFDPSLFDAIASMKWSLLRVAGPQFPC